MLFLERRKVRGPIVAVLGSGGHTTEVLSICSRLPCKFWPSVFILTSGDKFSAQKADAIFSKKIFLSIPRPRKVAQSYFSSIFTTLFSFIFTLKAIFTINPSMVNLHVTCRSFVMVLASVFQ